MKCSKCGGLVTWRGPIANMTHTQCENCGGINCQYPEYSDDPDPEEIGRTTKQMLDAPIGSFFVWCNGMIDYPTALAHHIGRDDLKIKSPEWVTAENLRGIRYSEIILDHAAYPTLEGLRALNRIKNVPKWANPEPADHYGSVACAKCGGLQADSFKACIYCCNHTVLDFVDEWLGDNDFGGWGLTYVCRECGKNFDFDNEMMKREYEIRKK